jgi:hypothetical protein
MSVIRFSQLYHEERQASKWRRLLKDPVTAFFVDKAEEALAVGGVSKIRLLQAL